MVYFMVSIPSFEMDDDWRYPYDSGSLNFTDKDSDKSWQITMNHHVMLTVGSLFWGGITINQSISFHPKKSGEVGADPPPRRRGAEDRPCPQHLRSPRRACRPPSAPRGLSHGESPKKAEENEMHPWWGFSTIDSLLEDLIYHENYSHLWVKSMIRSTIFAIKWPWATFLATWRI